MSHDHSPKRKILIVKLSSLGDLFHALPVVHVLKTAYNAEIHWVTQAGFRPIVERFEDVDSILTFPRDHFLTGYPGFLRHLRETRYDLVVDLQGLLKSALLVGRAARAKHRVGVPCGREGAAFFYEAAAKESGVHAVDRLLQVVKVLDLEIPETPKFPVSFPKVPYREEKPRVAFVPSSRWPAKDWPAARFIDVGQAIQDRKDVAIYLLGGPADGDLCREIQQGLKGRVVNLCGQTDLVQLGSTIGGMDLVLTVDSGPMHMAAALEVPTVSLFGVTDPKRTGPYGKNHKIFLSEQYESHEDLPRLFKKSELAGTWDINTTAVVDAVFEVLN